MAEDDDDPNSNPAKSDFVKAARRAAAAAERAALIAPDLSEIMREVRRSREEAREGEQVGDHADATEVSSGQDPTPAASPSTPLRLTDASKERLKLRAAFLSGLGSNIVATGTLGSILAFAFANQLTSDQSFFAAGFGLLCFFGGFGLHFVAEATLQGIKE